MRPIVLAQIVSTLLIGVVSATPADIDMRSVEPSNTDLTEACVNEVVYYEDKGCDTEECHHDRPKKKARKCRHRHEDDEEDHKRKNMYHGKEDEDEDNKRKYKHHRKGDEDDEDDDDEDDKKEKKVKGYRCENKNITKSSVESSSKEGCEYLKTNTKSTKGYARGYPMLYIPGSGDHVYGSKVIDVGSKYYLYPIQPAPASYRFAAPVSEMILMDTKCAIVGTTVKKTTTTCPTKSWCLSSFFKSPNYYYTSCIPTY